MKKIIESDLISIAHRILKLKDKSEISSLLKETELLHNKLILLQFYEENKFRLDANITEEKLIAVAENSSEIELQSAKPEVEETFVVTATESEEEVENNHPEVVETEKETWEFTPTIEETQKTVQEIDEQIEQIEAHNPEDDFKKAVEHVAESERPNDEFTPTIEETQKTAEVIEEQIQEIEAKDPVEDAKEAVERVATLEIDPVFSIAHEQLFSDNATSQTAKEENENKGTQHFVTNQNETTSLENYRQVPLNKSINDAFANKISIGLNDRIAFEKNLFNGSSEDLNRVISQLNTIETYQEAQDFIDDLVKPEFNNWQGKEEYAHRFMELVEKRFL